MRQNSAAATDDVTGERLPDQARTLAERLFETRNLSLTLAAPLSPEDMVVQAMDDASPTKWHLAHVTWFFENFVLKPHLEDYRLFDDTFNYCFNSYYESLGPRHPRPKRGLLTRPSAERVLEYRAHVDGGLETLLSRDEGSSADLARLIEIGINHEQQHQELLLTDILALFAGSPLRPAYQAAPSALDVSDADPVRWISYAGGIYRVGHSTEGYCWDNELPSHEALVHPFRIADRLVTNAEWLAFMEDGGYATPSLWLADGWATINREGWQAPLYWEHTNGGWFQMSLQGLSLSRAGRARCACLLLRSRCVRALGRQEIADGIRMGSRGNGRRGAGEYAADWRAATTAR